MTYRSERKPGARRRKPPGFPCSHYIAPVALLCRTNDASRIDRPPSLDERGRAALSNSPHEGRAKPLLQTSSHGKGCNTPFQTIPIPILTRPLVGAARSSLTDFGSCTSYSGVKDFAVPPIFSRRPSGVVRKSAPPLAAAGGRYAIPDSSQLRCPTLSSARERSMT